jgi:hypothetical protein
MQGMKLEDPSVVISMMDALSAVSDMCVHPDA